MTIYSKKISVGAFLKKGEDFKDKDLVEVASEGKRIEGKYGPQDVFLIKVGDKEGNTSFNQTSMNNMIDAFGPDSLKWIGKQVKVWAILSNVQGKMTKVYYFSHPDADIGEDGSFIIPNAHKEIQSTKDERVDEEIDPADIPF